MTKPKKNECVLGCGFKFKKQESETAKRTLNKFFPNAKIGEGILPSEEEEHMTFTHGFSLQYKDNESNTAERWVCIADTGPYKVGDSIERGKDTKVIPASLMMKDNEKTVRTHREFHGKL